MDDVQAALKLLDGISFRDRIEEDERVPAWRAIKLLYRSGVSADLCGHLVDGVRKLHKPHACGPTLSYYLNLARSACKDAQEGQDS